MNQRFTKEDLDFLAIYFEPKTECEARRREYDKREADRDIMMAKANTQLSAVIAILGAIGVALLPVAIKFILGG